MITCNRCGKQIPAGAANCQNCGMPVSSLGKGAMDAQEHPELPTWLESLRANERPRTPAGGQSFSASDLVGDDDLPGWMRPERAEMAEDANAGHFSAPRSSSMPAPNTDDGMIPPKGFSANLLVDSSSLPSWMQMNQPGSGSFPPAEMQGPLSAASLIEPDSLPSWMTGQPSQPPALPNHNQPGSGTGFNSFNSPPPASWQETPSFEAAPGEEESASRLSAASLLDMNALPNWLREGQQEYTNQPGPGGANSNLAAGSLIDMNALPAWLRNADSQPSGMQQGSNVPPAPYGTPPRIESVRVPSRPRAEMAPQEQSEVAANVFSSMLGVASWSSSPAPSSAFGSSPQQSFQSVPAQSSSPFSADPAASPGAIPNMSNTGQPMPQGFAGSPPVQGALPAGYPGGYQGVYQNGPNGQSGYAGYNQAPGQQLQPSGMPPDVYNAGQRTPVGQMNQVSQTGAKPARRGIIDTIREWFHL